MAASVLPPLLVLLALACTLFFTLTLTLTLHLHHIPLSSPSSSAPAPPQQYTDIPIVGRWKSVHASLGLDPALLPASVRVRVALPLPPPPVPVPGPRFDLPRASRFDLRRKRAAAAASSINIMGSNIMGEASSHPGEASSHPGGVQQLHFAPDALSRPVRTLAQAAESFRAVALQEKELLPVVYAEKGRRPARAGMTGKVVGKVAGKMAAAGKKGMQ
ncbi:hypothetical protein PLICRDRAFT_698363 [Plicaturopsis crispa FD-325 SS-3]|nr:hypothetical protein PLICRDRAFT_698363 [Plicaturopsis crispa FD-325 SS-3]